MAQIKPFRGYRYTLSRPEELARVIAPPYDMIDGTMREQLYGQDERNCVRLIQNKPEAQDSTNRDRHARATRIMQEWITRGVLQRDSEPGIYPYRQQFTVGSGEYATEYVRTGVIMRLRLVDFSEKIVIPHEHTLPGPKYDRYELLQEMRCNTGLIFGLVPDDGELYRTMCDSVTGEPQGVCTDEAGVTHQLYHSNDASVIDSLVQLVADRTVLIADGHHRYETSLKYARETNTPESDYVMIQLVSMADKGLVIRPFHRMVKVQDGVSADGVVEKLSGYFSMQSLGEAKEETVKEFCDGEDTEDMLYLDAYSHTLYRLSLNDKGEKAVQERDNGMSSRWNHLDVSLINTIFVERILSMPSDGETLHSLLEYVKDFKVAFDTVMNSSEYYGCFFLTPSSMEKVRELVGSGERMPQKSTNFYPKCYSGMVFNSLESE